MLPLASSGGVPGVDDDASNGATDWFRRESSRCTTHKYYRSDLSFPLDYFRFRRIAGATVATLRSGVRAERSCPPGFLRSVAQEELSYLARPIGEFAVTETEPHPTNRALVASFLFTDLVGFSMGTAAEQHAAKATLSAILRSNLAPLRKVDYRIKDTGDGALIAFVSNPEHALYMALAIAQDFGRAARDAGFPSNSLRTGVHLGTVKESIDVEARPNFIGDGINAAKRIMDFAAPGQITASRAFFDAVASLDSVYAELFRHAGAPGDKHGRTHELYTIAPSVAVLEKLKLDLGAPADELVEFGGKGPALAKAKQGSALAAGIDSSIKSSHATDVVRKWYLPVVVVIVLGVASIFAGTKLTEPNAPKVPQVTTESVLLPDSSKRALAPSTSAEGAVVDLQTSPAAPPKPEAATRDSRVAESVPSPNVAQPAVVPARTTATANTGAKSTFGSGVAQQPMAIPANAASDKSNPRCSRIMEKATLGEALSIEEKRELANSCR